MTARTSISRLADCAPVASPESWVARKVPGTHWAEIRHPYIDETPVMQAAHAAIEAEARATARAVIKMRAHLYALRPRELDAIFPALASHSPRGLVTRLGDIARDQAKRRLFGFGGEVPAINLRGAMLYARYLRAKAHQVAGGTK